jgi:hypothetical protein
MRKDLHRPSQINPEDYFLLNHNYMGDDPEILLAYSEEHKRLMKYLADGHKFEATNNAGTCQCCGAHAIYVADFVYAPTGNVVRLGHQCAEKMHIGDPEAFRTWRKLAADIRSLRAGKNKAALLLNEDYNMKGAETFIDMDVVGYKTHLGFTDGNGLFNHKINNQINILHDLVQKLVKYGSLSEKQVAFAQKLWSEVKNFDVVAYLKKDAEKKAEHAKLPSLEEGRRTITGKVISFKQPDEWSRFPVVKMLIEEEGGTRVFGTLPAALGDAQKGDVVSLVAKVTRSDKDHRFGFYSRPANAEILEVSC